MPTQARKVNRGAKGDGCLYQRGRLWWFKAPNGERYPTGKSTKDEAVIFKQDKIAELRAGTPQVITKSKETTVNQLLDAHLDYMRLKKRVSVEEVAGQLVLHVRPVFGERIASTVTTQDFHDFRTAKRKEEVIGDTTINRLLSFICSGYYTGFKRTTPRMVDFVPYFPKTSEADNVRQGFLTFEGYHKVLEQLPASIKPLFICAFHVSSRKGELKDILWSQVEFDEGLIRLDPPDTKNKNGRALPIYGNMLETLQAQWKLRKRDFPDCEHVFFWHKEDIAISNFMVPLVGKHIGNFDKIWHAAVEAAGYPGLLFHDLRRTAERNMTKAGMDISMRMKISGHKTNAMSIRYNIVTAADVAEGSVKLEDWFKKETAKQQAKTEKQIGGYESSDTLTSFPSPKRSRKRTNPKNRTRSRVRSCAAT
jgi:integrase